MRKNFTNKIIAATISALMLINVAVASAQTEAVGTTPVNEGQKRGMFGLRFMPTFSAIDFKTPGGGTVKGQTTVGFGAGVALGFNFSDHIGIQGELIYTSLSQKQSINNVDHKINLTYVNIPLLLSLNTGKTNMVNLKIVGGPQMGFNVGSELKTVGTGDGVDTVTAVLKVKKGDVGFAYGVGLDFGINPARTIRFDIGYRGVMGLIDISNHSQNAENNQYYLLDKTHVKTNSVYAGVTFLF